jgi:hypothetical protein
LGFRERPFGYWIPEYLAEWNEVSNSDALLMTVFYVPALNLHRFPHLYCPPGYTGNHKQHRSIKATDHAGTQYLLQHLG